MTDLRSLSPEQLQQTLTGQPAFRVRQIFDWLQRQGTGSFNEMTNLPHDLRAQLSKQFQLSTCEIARKQVSQHDGTVKYLFRLNDGEHIESVVMQYTHGHSICLSTQVGCRMGCVFCASNLYGCTRNLLAGEMLSQIHTAQHDLNITISHVVLMGMGEPLDNYDNTLQFLHLANHPQGLNISQRKISLSTCGLVPQIDMLARENLGITLSVSLHAPSDTLRTKLMPINHRYPIKTLLAACRNYTKTTGRRISFEYAMLHGVNDSLAHAHALSELLRGMLCHVNLIPANEIGRGFAPSLPQHLRKFQAVLEQNRINATVRRSLGKDIDAACGMLKSRNH